MLSNFEVRRGFIGDVTWRLLLGPDRRFVREGALSKIIRFTEHANLQIHAEAFNALNRANFSAPGTVFCATGFGVISNTEDLRQFQVAAKLYF